MRLRNARNFFKRKVLNEVQQQHGTVRQRQFIQQLHKPSLRFTPDQQVVRPATADAVEAMFKVFDDLKAAGELRQDLAPFALSRAITALFEGYAFQRALDQEIDTEAFKDRYGKLAVNVAKPSVAAAG